MRIKSNRVKKLKNILLILVIFLVILNTDKLNKSGTIFVVALLVSWLFIYNYIWYNRQQELITIDNDI